MLNSNEPEDFRDPESGRTYLNSNRPLPDPPSPSPTSDLPNSGSGAGSASSVGNPRPASVGHDPESGILTRLRHWTDVAPVLNLFRVMRLAGSPVAVAAVWGACIFANVLMVSEAADQGDRWRTSLLVSPLAIVIAMLLFRQGALLMAGRDMEPWGIVLRRIGNHALSTLAIVLTPLACVAAITILTLPISWLSLLSNHWLWQMPLAMLNLALLVPAGILLAGSLPAIPFALAAIVNEPDPDPLDSLSRGYEYTLRGWVPFVGSLLFATLLVAMIAPAAIALSTAAQQLLLIVTQVTSANGQWVWCGLMLQMLPIVLAIVVGCGSVGGIYLLLRRATGGQEIEDVWIPKPESSVSLPQWKKPGPSV